MQAVASFFRLFGDPILFLLKILIWTVIWFLKETYKALKNIYFIFNGTKETFGWLFEQLTPKLEIRIPKFETKFKTPKFKFPKPQIFSRDFLLVITGFLLCFFVVFLPYNAAIFLSNLPSPKLLVDGHQSVTTKIFDRNKTLLYEIYTNENRTPIKLADLPLYVWQATLAIEDKNFYQHFGVDPQAIVRAFVNNISGLPSQGGSTLTQQLIKSALLTPQKTYERKTKEILLSVWAERLYSKSQILEMYLNQIPYGGSAYGVEAAAKTYFNRSANELTLSQAALLAGLTAAPTIYSPLGTHPELAKQRQEAVLNAMVEKNYISKEQKDLADAETLNFASQLSVIKAPHFVMYVKDLLTQRYGARTVEQGGLEVITTLDYSLYEMVQKEIKSGVDRQNYLRVGNGAAVIINPKNGEILTMVGSTDYFDKSKDGNVNVTLSSRSPGSSIKPLTYALAFEKNLISPATVINDSPVTFSNLGSTSYSPQNYDQRYHGSVTARVALGSSYNVPAVKILSRIGLTEYLKRGQEAGIKSWDDPSRYGLSLTLGGGEVTMLEMVQLYGIFANNGLRTNINSIISVTDYKGNILEKLEIRNSKPETRIFSPHTAFLISDILSDNGARSPAFGSSSPLVIPGKTVAVKTGTTENKRDNWTLGYTPSVVAGVWVGNNDNSPMSPYLESGNTGAAAIWHEIMVNLLKDKSNEKFSLPDNLITVEICTINGLLPCENCPSVKREYFVSGTEPKTACKIEKVEEKK